MFCFGRFYCLGHFEFVPQKNKRHEIFAATHKVNDTLATHFSKQKRVPFNKNLKMMRLSLMLLMTLCVSCCGGAATLRGSSSLSNVVDSPQEQHPSSRRERFPSVEERVQIYMSNWYSPPCHENDRILYTTKGEDVQVHNMTIRPHIQPDTLFQLKKDIAIQCAKGQQERAFDEEHNITSPHERYVDSRFRGNMVIYCSDVVEVFEILSHVPPLETPILYQFGDMKHSHDFGFVNIPHFKKFRSATDNLLSVLSSDCVSSPRPTLPSAHHEGNSMQPIVWKLATHRHFKHLPNVNKYDTPWSLKKDMAIFRGQLTGALEHYDKNISAQENCNNMLRCHLVQRHANSTLIDAKLTTTRNRLPDTIGGVELVSQKVSTLR